MILKYLEINKVIKNIAKKLCFCCLFVLILSVNNFASNQNQSTQTPSNHPKGAEEEIEALNLKFTNFWQTNLDSARTMAFQALTIAKDHNLIAQEANAYNNIGATYYFQGASNEALKYYQLAQQVFDASDLPKTEQFNVKLNLGRVFIDLGKYNEGIDFLMQALKIANQKQNDDNLSLVLFSISQVYFDLNKIDDALTFYNYALNFAHKAKNKVRISQVLGDIGNVYFIKNDLNLALKYYNQSRAVKTEINDLSGMSTTLLNIGNVYENIADSNDADLGDDLRMSNYQIALDYYKQSLEISTKLNLKKNQSLVLNNIGLLQLKTGKPQDGLVNCKKSLEIAEETGTLIRVRDACECLYRAHKDLNQHQLALSYFEKYSRARDSIFSEEHVKKINRLQFEQELEMKEAMRKAELVKQKELSVIELRQQQFKFRIVLVILAILLFALAFLMFQRKRIKQNNKNLVRKNIELMHSEAMLIQTQLQLQNDIAIEKNKPNLLVSETIDSKEQKTQKNLASDEQTKTLTKEIDRLLLHEKLFLDPDLTLQVLVEKLNSNSSYVSRAINEHYGKNFNTLINEFRIKEARKMLANSSFNHLTIEGIAREVGFNSIPSFNNAFKKFTGISPSFFKSTAQNRADQD